MRTNLGEQLESTTTCIILILQRVVFENYEICGCEGSREIGWLIDVENQGTNNNIQSLVNKCAKS